MGSVSGRLGWQWGKGYTLYKDLREQSKTNQLLCSRMEIREMLLLVIIVMLFSVEHFKNLAYF